MHRSEKTSNFRRALLIALGVACAGQGVTGFLQPNHFIDGGVTGVSMLASHVGGFPLALLLPLLNLPFLIVGYREIGTAFAVRSVLAIAALALVLAFVHFPYVTSDKLLTAVFGGIFLGAGIGFTMRGGAVLDGTEILALLLSRRGGYAVGEIVLSLNIGIFASAAFFLGIETAMYSTLTYFSASKMIDFVVYGAEETYSMMIVSKKWEEIRDAILTDLSRGVTCLEGRGGMSDEPQSVLYCVLTKIEVARAKGIIMDIDASAFLVVQHVSDVSGGLVRRNTLEELKSRA